MTPPAAPDSPSPVTNVDRYEWLFARNWDSVQNRIENALFCLTTLAWDEQTKHSTVTELNDAMAMLYKLRETWPPAPDNEEG